MKLNHLDAEKQPKKFFQAFWWFIRVPFIKKENIEQPRATYEVQKSVKALRDFLNSADNIEPAYQQMASTEYCPVMIEYFRKHGLIK